MSSHLLHPQLSLHSAMRLIRLHMKLCMKLDYYLKCSAANIKRFLQTYPKDAMSELSFAASVVHCL